ncbi:MAG: glutathione S-transferase family protein [Sphingopyxis sp.]
MWQLYQFPLCPFSRKVRLLLGEKGLAYDLVSEYPWEHRSGFRDINLVGCTPAMRHSERGITLADSVAICEYFEETEPAKPLYAGSAVVRAEIRRLISWFDTKFYAEVGAPLLMEKMIKRLFYRQPPDAPALRQSMRAANEHMEMLGTALDHHRWLTGATITMADFAAAAHLSVADYLGGIDWAGHDTVHDWYAAMKSRPSFRPLLDERMGPLMPPAHYGDVNF